jgi:hypothetical protein
MHTAGGPVQVIEHKCRRGYLHGEAAWHGKREASRLGEGGEGVGTSTRC